MFARFRVLLPLPQSWPWGLATWPSVFSLQNSHLVTPMKMLPGPSTRAVLFQLPPSPALHSDQVFSLSLSLCVGLNLSPESIPQLPSPLSPSCAHTVESDSLSDRYWLLCYPQPLLVQRAGGQGSGPVFSFPFNCL